MRLFFALCFAPEACRAIREVQRWLRALAGPGNYTRPENLHLTLAFLGEQPPEGLAAARRALAEAAAPPLSPHLRPPGPFSPGERSSVVDRPFGNPGPHGPLHISLGRSGAGGFSPGTTAFPPAPDPGPAASGGPPGGGNTASPRAHPGGDGGAPSHGEPAPRWPPRLPPPGQPLKPRLQSRRWTNGRFWGTMGKNHPWKGAARHAGPLVCGL